MLKKKKKKQGWILSYPYDAYVQVFSFSMAVQAIDALYVSFLWSVHVGISLVSFEPFLTSIATIHMITKEVRMQWIQTSMT